MNIKHSTRSYAGGLIVLKGTDQRLSKLQFHTYFVSSIAFAQKNGAERTEQTIGREYLAQVCKDGLFPSFIDSNNVLRV